MNIGHLQATLGVDTRGLTRGRQEMKGFERQTVRSSRRMSKSLSNLTNTINAVIGALAVREVGRFAGELKETAVNAEETANKFNVLFGALDERAGRVVEEISRRYDLATQSTKELLSKVGDLTQGFGMNKRLSLELSNNVARLG